MECGWFTIQDGASTMLVIFDITRSACGPTEQPKSATFMQFGEESWYNFIIVSSSMGLALSISFFFFFLQWIKIKVGSMYKKRKQI